MSQQVPPERPSKPTPEAKASAVAVISAYGAFRLLLILLALWTFFEGFALFTGGLSALSFGGNDTSERVVGGQMIVFVPVYALLAWQRERYRLLIWVPYGAQLAIIVPGLWALLAHGETDGILLTIVSLIFFVLLFYFWWHSHPLDFFAEEEEEGAGGEGGEAEDEDDGAARGQRARQPVRARDVARKQGRFRRRDG